MSIDRRNRAHYSNALGPIGFFNPGDGPLHSVRMCIVDTMFHVCLHHDPLENHDDPIEHWTLRKSLMNSNSAVNGTEPAIGLAEWEDRDGSGLRLEIWYPGSVDLEDMVKIIENVPQLEGAWLRAALQKKNIEAGLEAKDFPHFDGDANPVYAGWDGNNGFYLRSWISAKGGTMYFKADTPPSLITELQRQMELKNAQLDPAVINADGRNSAISLRFVWNGAKKNIRATRQAVHEVLDHTPGVIDYKAGPVLEARNRPVTLTPAT